MFISIMCLAWVSYASFAGEVGSRKNSPTSWPKVIVLYTSGMLKLEHTSNACENENIILATCFDIGTDSQRCAFERRNTSIGTLYYLDVQGDMPKLYACDDHFKTVVSFDCPQTNDLYFYLCILTWVSVPLILGTLILVKNSKRNVCGVLNK